MPAESEDFLSSEIPVLVERLIRELNQRGHGGKLDIHLVQAIGHEIKRRGGWKLQNQVIEQVRARTNGKDARIIEFHWEDFATQYPPLTQKPTPSPQIQGIPADAPVGPSEQRVECALCKRQVTVTEARVYHDQPSDKWFCLAECWPRRGKVIKSGIGYDCPFYSEGMCRVRGGDSLCSLGIGNYWTDCHVYPTTGLKGKYDKEQGEAARRRALLKRCKRCDVALEISENVDFRWGIGELASERDFKEAADACGFSCASCRADFCRKCMQTFGERHADSGGLACLNCGGRMAKFNP